MLNSSPSIRSSFIGREDDVREIAVLLGQPGTRLLTITGPGGVGKTRLAIEFLSGLAPVMTGGIWMVPLAHVRQPDLVLSAIAAELGIRDIVAGETLERIAERLAGEPSLLLLDNLEQVIDCGPLIVALLQHAPKLVILATSRQPLQMNFEIEYPLRPLRTDASGLEESPAEQLFVMRAREASYGFVVTDENRAAIRQIAHQLGGVPLAIELAASWVKVLPPHRLQENLDRQLDVLVRGPRDLPERQQTIRATIAWSYQLLTPAEQALFRRLGVFQGGFTLFDIESIAGSSLDVLEGLSSLVTKSLVQVTDEPVDPAQPEYTVLEIIRAFALEQLQEGDEATALYHRHLAHFVQLAEAWTIDLGSARRDRRLAQLDREKPNFRAALRWAHESGQIESGMRLVSALWVYWDWRGFHAEGAHWGDRILAMAEPVDPPIRSSALYAGAAIAFMQADYPRSLALAEACLEVAEASGDDRSIGRALIALGNSAYDQGDLHRAETVYARSLETIRRIDEPDALQVALVNLGFVRYQQERYAAARELFEEATGPAQGTGKTGGLAWAEVGLAQVELRTGQVGAAEERLTGLIDQQRESDSGQLGVSLSTLAAVWRTQGRLTEAEALARESLSNRVAREERAFITDSLAEIGAIALASGAFETGVTIAAAVAAQRERLGYGLPDRERFLHQELLEHVRRHWTAAAFDAAWAKGARMTMNEAVAFTEAPPAPARPERMANAQETAADHASMLTRREREVLQLIVDGRTDREIAHTLSISSGTASRHVANILRKLDVRTRSAAAAWAIRSGLT